MNRLILIGNGFDLAHGLKTNYKDFIFWYLDQCFSQSGIYANVHSYEDDFLNVEVIEHYRLMDLAKSAGNMGISRYLYENKILKSYLDFDPKRNYVSPTNIDKYRYISKISAHHVSFRSNFFKRLIDTCLECGWVDIEQEYFDALKRYNDKDNSPDIDYIRTLNKHFSFLVGKLQEYLFLQENSDLVIHNQLLVAFISGFQINDFDTVIDRESVLQNQLMEIVEERNQDRALVVNFNYTNTFETYLQRIQDNGRYVNIDINYIHGKLNDPHNSIIFGFGDEHDKDYTNFEEQGNNSLFEHVKSYHYLKTPNYRDLIRFLNEDQFQVFIVGHSCGLSDRTMFKEIFDHENCKSVRIFHYTDKDGKNDFFDKSINLGRHFSDKGRMRKLIVNFNEADAIPQLEKK
ncbi:AbiH family protein [Sphingobacterium sp. NPDC055346]